MMSSSPKCLNQSQSLKPPLRAALRNLLGKSPPALRSAPQNSLGGRCPHARHREQDLQPSLGGRCPHARRREQDLKPALGGRCPHAQHREQDLKPALRAALHSMLGSSPPAMRCRCLSNTPRLCVTQNGRTIRRPHARRRSQQLKPAVVKVIKPLQGFQDLWNRQMSLRSKNRLHHHLTSRSTLLRSA